MVDNHKEVVQIHQYLDNLNLRRQLKGVTLSAYERVKLLGEIYKSIIKAKRSK